MVLYPKKITDYQLLFRLVKPNCITIALRTGGNSYFQKNGHVMGFSFELMKKYCADIEHKPVFVVEEDINKRLDLLYSNKADIVICDESTDSIPKLKNTVSWYVYGNSLPVLWVANEENKSLARDMRFWITSFAETMTYRILAAKYSMAANQNTHQLQISIYDDIIRKYAEKINWDWRLIAALIYQESNFVPNARSSKDAIGLMQIRPQTIRFLGMDSINSNEKNIDAGTKLIKYLDGYYANDSVSDKNERIKFVLAAYNSGQGKINLFRNNTKRKNGNPNIWNHVEAMNQQKRGNKTSVKEPVLSRETILFVREILDRYEHYKNLFPYYK